MNHGELLALPPVASTAARILGMSRRLGHSTIGITADLYTHIVPAVARDAATRIADLVRGSQSVREES